MSNLEPGTAAPDLAPIFAALGDSTRLALLAKLNDGQIQSIARLSADTALTRQAITKHLRVLEDVGLVQCRRVGRESQFAFRPDPIVRIRTYLEEVSELWDDALARLRTFVEG